MKRSIFSIASVPMCFFLAACATPRTHIDDVYNQAREAYSRKEYEQARLYYKKFFNDDPRNPMGDVALYYWADSARKAGWFKEAKDVYNKLIEKYQTGFWVELAKKDLKAMDHTRYFPHGMIGH